jgi:hypothetical protein
VTVLGGAVLVLGDPDLGGAVKQTFDADPCLGPSKLSTGAGVNTSPKSDVTLGVWTRRVECVWIVELFRVAVGGPVEHHKGGAGRNVNAANGARYPRQPEITLDRTFDPQGLLDEVGDPVTLATQQLLDVGRSASIFRAELSNRTVVFWPAEKTLVATRTTSMTSGVDPSGKIAAATPVRTSSRGSRRRSSM